MKRISLFSLALLYAFSIHAAADIEIPDISNPAISEERAAPLGEYAIIVTRNSADDGFGNTVPIPFDAEEAYPFTVKAITGAPEIQNITSSYRGYSFSNTYGDQALKLSRAALTENPGAAYVMIFNVENEIESAMALKHTQISCEEEETIRKRLTAYPHITRVGYKKFPTHFSPIPYIGRFCLFDTSQQIPLEDMIKICSSHFTALVEAKCKKILTGRDSTGLASVVLVNINRTWGGFGSCIPLDSVDAKPLTLTTIWPIDTFLNTRLYNCELKNEIMDEEVVEKIQKLLTDSPNSVAAIFYDADGNIVDKRILPNDFRVHTKARDLLDTVPKIELEATSLEKYYDLGNWKVRLANKRHITWLSHALFNRLSLKEIDTELNDIKETVLTEHFRKRITDYRSKRIEISPIADSLS